MILSPVFLHAQVHLPVKQGQKITIYHDTHYSQVNWKTFLIRFKVVMVRIEQLETKKHTASKPNLPHCCVYTTFV